MPTNGLSFNSVPDSMTQRALSHNFSLEEKSRREQMILNKDFYYGKQEQQLSLVNEDVDPAIRKIQWVPYESNVKVHVLKPDGQVTHGRAENTIKTLLLGTVLQFERYGYIKIQKIEKNEIYCYFTQ